MEITGWTFEGWYTDNETFKNKVEATTVCTATSNHTLYAKWTQNPSNTKPSLLQNIHESINKRNADAKENAKIEIYGR